MLTRPSPDFGICFLYAAPLCAATLEEARERGELQRAYYGLLHTLVVGAGMSRVLLSTASTPAPAPPVGASGLMDAQQVCVHACTCVRA